MKSEERKAVQPHIHPNGQSSLIYVKLRSETR